MSAHLRRVIAVRLVAAALTAAVPAAWVIGRVRQLGRQGRQRPVPGLPADGEPLERWEFVILAGLAQDLANDRGRSRT